MSRFGGVLGFDLGRREARRAFLAALELVTEATSFGGVLTHAPSGAAAGAATTCPTGFIRLSAGCEDAEDLVADVRAGARRVSCRR